MLDPVVQKEPLNEEVRFNILKGWAMEHGVLGLEQVEFPATIYDNFMPTDSNFGYTGVRARADIGHRKPILAAPFSTLISPKTFEDEEPHLYA